MADPLSRLILHAKQPLPPGSSCMGQDCHLTTSPKLPTLKANAATAGITHMTVTVKAGHKNGQDLEFRMSGGVITILPKLPDADDEYTRGQRRIIDARLAEGLADIKAGRTFGPFDNAGEMIAHMKAQLKKRGIAPRPNALDEG